MAKHDWPGSLPFSMLRAESDPVRHLMLLQRCFDGREMRWSDALIVRTRRHIGGSLSAVEIALRLEMERLQPESSAMFRNVGDYCCWNRVERDPVLLSAELLSHLRDRAAISLMQNDLAPAGLGDADSAPGYVFSPDIEEALSTIRLAQISWADMGPDQSPMRTDLLAEVMPDLIWTAVAILTDALVRAGLEPTRQVLAWADQAGQALLARYDEQNTPFVQSALLAHRLRAIPLGDDAILQLARGRHIIPLLAIMADRTGIDLNMVIRAVVEGSEQMLFILCRAAEFSREAAVRLVLGRKGVVRGVDDSMLVDLADSYDLMSPSEASDAVLWLRVAQPLRAKLALVRGDEARDGH
ncbi:MAG: DUF2336 domain-containing protein [Sphingobium sp.]